MAEGYNGPYTGQYVDNKLAPSKQITLNVPASSWVLSGGLWKAEILGLTDIVEGSFSVIKTDSITTINPTPEIGVGKIALTSSDQITEELSFIVDIISYAGAVTSGVVVTNSAGSGSGDLRETVSISLYSNQPQPDSSLNGVTVTITDVDTEDILLSEIWNGNNILTKIQPLTNYRVSVTSVEGYSHPTDQTYTASVQSFRLVDFYFNAELLTVNLSKDDGGSVSDIQVSVINENNQSIIASLFSGQSVKIPYGINYRIVSPYIPTYKTPNVISFLSSQISRISNIEYVKIIPNYITINQNISDPETMISGDINGDSIKWIRNNSHRYLSKYTNNAEMTICQLDDSDSRRYFDGTTSVLTGEEGDVFMKLPRFFYNAQELQSDIWRIGFSLEKVNDTWHEWDGNDLIGTYEINNVSGKAYSLSGIPSTGSISQANWKTYATARGEGYSLVKWKHHNIMAILFYAIYGNMNSQLIVGSGTPAYAKINGMTDSLGMTDTVGDVNGNIQSINYFGLENWWGNKSEYIDNVVLNSGGILTITEDDGSTRNIQGFLLEGNFIQKTMIGQNIDLIVKSSDQATSTTGYCDYQGLINTNNAIIRRSFNSNSAEGGISYLRGGDLPTATTRDACSRLAFRGSIVETNNVDEFKQIPITN